MPWRNDRILGSIFACGTAVALAITGLNCICPDLGQLASPMIEETSSGISFTISTTALDFMSVDASI